MWRVGGCRVRVCLLVVVGGTCMWRVGGCRPSTALQVAAPLTSCALPPPPCPSPSPGRCGTDSRKDIHFTVECSNAASRDALQRHVAHVAHLVRAGRVSVVAAGADAGAGAASSSLPATDIVAGPTLVQRGSEEWFGELLPVTSTSQSCRHTHMHSRVPVDFGNPCRLRRKMGVVGGGGGEWGPA
jgi:hypothetical protein